MVEMRKIFFEDEQDFNKKEIEEQKYYFVTEHNDLVAKARHDLTARELKIMDYVVSKIKPDDEEFNTIKTSMKEIAEVLGLTRSGRTYRQIAENLSSMRRKDIYIYNDTEKRLTMTGWFEIVDLWENGKVELKINKQFAPYLLQLKEKGNYTQYLLFDVVQLKSKYSILLYKLMRETDKSRGKRIAVLQGTPEKFREWLGVSEEIPYGRFKSRMLNKAIEEINLKIDDMDLQLFQGKRGRTVVQVEIHNNFTR